MVGVGAPLFGMAFLPAVRRHRRARRHRRLPLRARSAPLQNYAMQTRTPEDMRGRAFGVLTSAAYAAGPIGYLLVGPLVEALGLRPAFLLLSGGLVLVTLAAIPARGLRLLDEPPLYAASPDEELDADPLRHPPRRAVRSPPAGRGRLTRVAISRRLRRARCRSPWPVAPPTPPVGPPGAGTAVGQGADDLRRHAGDDRVVGDLAPDDRAGGHHAVPTDAGTGQDDRAVAQPGAPAHRHGLVVTQLPADRDVEVVEAVVGVGDVDPWPNQTSSPISIDSWATRPHRMLIRQRSPMTNARSGTSG